MVRLSHALVASTITVILAAVLAFVGGWETSRVMGNMPLRTFVSATLADQTGDGIAPTEASTSFTVFWEVWDLVQREFYHTEPLDQQQMTYGAIRGMLASLGDEYTIFQEPEAAERSRESMQGSFEGIGVYMKLEGGHIVVERPIRESPAMKAGLQPNDVIIAVDGEELRPLLEGLLDSEAMDLAAELIRGPRGSTVILTVRRPPGEETFDVAIVRDEVPLISVNAQMLDGDIAYIQLTEFKATTTEELDEALRDLLPLEPQGLILDLRNNPGGFLRTAQEVLGRFYEGTALHESWSDGSTEELMTIRAPSDVQVFDLPLVVLINNGSASASEIVAGALRDERPDTVLLGERSFGKGSVQNIHRLSDGSSTRITVAHWFTPGRDEIQDVGIVPEYVVPLLQDAQYEVPCVESVQPPDGQEQCYDAQLSWGMRMLTEDATPPPVTE